MWIKMFKRGKKETEICQKGQKLLKKGCKNGKNGPKGVKKFWLMVWHNYLKSDVNWVKYDKKFKKGLK